MESKLERRIKYLSDKLQATNKIVCKLEESGTGGGLNETQVNELIQEAPVNSNTQAEIDGLQQQIDNIETGGDTPPSFSDSNEFQI